MQNIEDFKLSFSRPLMINESVLNEFFIPLSKVEQDYNITQDTNWSNPDIRPNKFDQTWQNWFSRIGTWGKINIIHVDPEKNTRTNMSKEQFISRMGNADMLKVYGKWEIQQVKINKMELWNTYIGINGKEYKEIIQIKVDLLPKLSKGLGLWQKLF